MRRFLTISIILFLLFTSFYLDNHFIHATSLDFYGKINLETGFSITEGNETNLLVEKGLYQGSKTNYLLDLNLVGKLGSFYIDSYLYYPENKEAELKIDLENENWSIKYQPNEINIPDLKTFFNKQKIEGLNITRTNGSLQLFTGKKLFQTKNKIFISDGRQLSFSLFNSTEGDIVEFSEVVFIDGKKIERYKDYKINYLSGDLKILIPLNWGAIIEVKYNFLPTGYEINDTLSGGYFQTELDKAKTSYLGLFYFHDINEELKESLDIPEKIEIKKAKYLGSYAKIITGPFSLTGELGMQQTDHLTNDYAGNLSVKYNTANTDFHYQYVTASPHFTGIGAIPITYGTKHELIAKYHFYPGWRFDLNLSGVDKSDEFTEKISRNTDLGLNYQFNDNHSFSLNLDHNSLEEWGQKYSKVDYQLGWNYQITRQMNFQLKNSLTQLDKREISFNLKDPDYRVDILLKQYPGFIPYYGEQWTKEFYADILLYPYKGIRFISDIDYIQPFEKNFFQASKRLALTLFALPEKNFNTRSNFIYFFNPETLVTTLYYDVSSTINLPLNLQLMGAAEKIKTESLVVSNADQNWSIGLSLPILEQINITYNLEKKQQLSFLKDAQIYSRDNNTLSHFFSTDILLNKDLTLSVTLTNQNSIQIVNTSKINNSNKEIGLNLKYFKDFNQIKYLISNVITDKENEIVNNLYIKNELPYCNYHYEGKLIYNLNFRRITEHEQYLEINLFPQQNPFNIGVILDYQFIKKNEKDYEKFDLSSVLSYAISSQKNIYIKSGNSKYTDKLKESNNYLAYYLKTGIEYSF